MKNERKITDKFKKLSQEALNKKDNPIVDNFFTNWRDKVDNDKQLKIEDSNTVRELKEHDQDTSLVTKNWIRSIWGKDAVKRTRRLRDYLKGKSDE